MKKRVYLWIGIFLLLASWAPGQNRQNLILNPKTAGKIRGEVSGKICLEHIRNLSVFCRWYGSDDMEKAAEFVKSTAEKYGLSDAAIERFPVDEDTYYYMQKPWYAWNCTRGELRMVDPEYKLIASYEANCPCVLVNSRDAEVEAEVVFVGDGMSPKDYEGKDVAGKIVLAYGHPWIVSKAAVLERKAAGILIAWPENTPGINPTDISQIPICPWNEDRSIQSTFGFSLSSKQGRFLLDKLEQNSKVVLQAKVKAEVRVPGYHQGVTATIPGAVYPDEEIIFTAHLDHPSPGAHDNNSGCAVLLETARVIKTLVDQKLIEPPKRTLRFYWTPHVWGVDMLFKTHPELFSKTIANINIDCVGIDQTKVSSGFTLVKAPFSRASFLDDIFKNVLDYVIRTNNNHMGQLPHGPEILDHDGSDNVFYGRTVPYMDYSDHVFFNSGSVGIPAVTLIDLPFTSHHSQNDKLEWLDPTQLKRISFLAVAASYYLAAAGPKESLSILDEIYHCGKVRMENEVKLAKSLIREEESPAKIHSQFQAAKNLILHGIDREKRALSSARLFIKGDPAGEKSLSRLLKEMESYEAKLLAGLEDIYAWQCANLEIQPEEPVLTEMERTLQNIIPERNPELKGTFGLLNHYPEDRYVFERFSPMYAYHYELLNLMDGNRDMLDIIRAVEAEALSSNYQTYSYEDVMEFLRLLQEDGIITANLPRRK